MKKIMILGASILQLPAIVQAKKMGLDVVVADMNPDAIGFKEDNIQKEIISTTDVYSILSAAKKHRIDGIMTLASDMPMRTVAVVAKEMQLVGISEKTAILATNKFEMRKALKKANVPVPLFYKISNENELTKTIGFFTHKFIMKPADNSGSRGVFLVDNIGDAKKAYNYSKKYSRNGDVIAEEYMEGPEVSVETLSIDGTCHVIQITDKLTTGAPHFVEMGHSQPCRLSDNLKKEITDVAIAANKAIGIENGPSHTEIIVTKDGPKIVEIGARLGGDCITTHLVPYSTGVNMVEACIKIALGIGVNIKKEFNKGAAIRYIPQQKGFVSKVSGVDSALAVSGIKEVFISIKPGDYVDNISNSTSRIGFVISQDESAESAISDCEIALERIKIIVGE